MSDDKTATDVAEPKVDTKAQDDALQAELKKVIAERDKAKAKLREREEADRKAAEDKAIEEGKTKELLAQRESELADLKKYKEAVETARQEKRAKVLDGIADPAVKKFADKMTDADEILEFLKVVEEKKLTTHTGKQPSTAPERPKFKSGHEWQKAMLDSGVGT